MKLFGAIPLCHFLQIGQGMKLCFERETVVSVSAPVCFTHSIQLQYNVSTMITQVETWHCAIFSLSSHHTTRILPPFMHKIMDNHPKGIEMESVKNWSYVSVNWFCLCHQWKLSTQDTEVLF